jgi:multicomponent Na+:H+ antiporter subunit D
MISQAAVDEQLVVIWFILMAASAGVFLHAGIKFPWFVFFQKDSGLRPPDPPWNMRLAMVLFAGLCIGLGIWPEYLYAMLPFPVVYQPYTVPHVVNMLQLLLFSGLAFFLMLPLMRRTLTITLDFDWFYRKLGNSLNRGLDRAFKAQHDFELATRARLAKITTVSRRYLLEPKGAFAATQQAGTMALIMMVVLLAFLIVFLFFKE